MTRPRLLVLDDDAAILALLRCYFGGLGWRVEVCAEAPQALAIIDTDAYDALICDLHVGGAGNGSEGLEVVSRARQRWPRAGVVLFTGAAGQGVRGAALEAGADDVVAKPAPLARLREAALHAIRSKAS
jgi:CheY-like chemotaxis protein